MIQVGIIGGAGYTAGELIRLILHHPKAEINFVYSTSNAGNKIYDVHQDLYGDTELKFIDSINSEVDILFLCLGHGNSTQFLKENSFSINTKIIDLSNDFRLESSNIIDGKAFVYGLPELQKEEIIKANYIANPGCFATALQLAILPLASHKLLFDDIHIHAVTGATGAGTAVSATSHFPWRDNNISHYKAFSHQHLDEINQTVQNLQPEFSSEINFIPNRGNFSRGIFATIYTKFTGSMDEAKEMYQSYYKEAAFTFISDNELHLKQVVNTNKCLMHIEQKENKIVIHTAIDNLLKGAVGQAVQNMNLMMGLEETAGIQLKAINF
jgi:N-acetyl-gamma-glutamyl-phosphate reductase